MYDYVMIMSVASDQVLFDSLDLAERFIEDAEIGRSQYTEGAFAGLLRSREILRAELVRRMARAGYLDHSSSAFIF